MFIECSQPQSRAHSRRISEDRHMRRIASQFSRPLRSEHNVNISEPVFAVGGSGVGCRVQASFWTNFFHGCNMVQPHLDFKN